MQNGKTYAGNDEREVLGGEQRAPQQLEEILASGLSPLYRRAYSILGNATDAEDAVQDALLAAHTHLKQFKGHAQISTWFTTILLNCARLQLRQRSRHVHVSLDASSGELQPLSQSEWIVDHRPNPEHEFIESELKARLTDLRRQLSPTLRRTFQLRDIDGLSIRETAKILGIPSGTVKARSARARKKVSEFMRRALRPPSRGLGCRVPGFEASGRALRWKRLQ